MAIMDFLVFCLNPWKQQIMDDGPSGPSRHHNLPSQPSQATLEAVKLGKSSNVTEGAIGHFVLVNSALIIAALSKGTI
jgi:hypothetical protein